MRTYAKICAIFLALVLAVPAFSACSADGAPEPYLSGEHTHIYGGDWYDVAPAEGESAVTQEVRYCRICHAEDVREKE